MYIGDPITVDGTVLTSSSVAEPDATVGEETLSGTYDTGEKAISTTLHWEWVSAIDANAAALPTTAGESNASWISVGPTNRYRMFYLASTVPTTAASPFTVTLAPGEIVDTTGMDGLVADYVTITVTKSGNTLYSETIKLFGRNTLSWSDYRWGRFFQINETAKFDLPKRTGVVITLTFTRASGGVSVGRALFCRKEYGGEATLGAASSVINYSSWTRGINGESAFTARRNVPRASFTAFHDKNRVNKLRQLRDALNARIGLWSWLDDADHDYFGAGFIIGGYKEMTISADQPDHATTKYEIEGA